MSQYCGCWWPGALASHQSLRLSDASHATVNQAIIGSDNDLSPVQGQVIFWNGTYAITSQDARPHFNTKMLSFQHKKFHCGDKTILQPSYLHNRIFSTGKMILFLYWIKALISIQQATVTDGPSSMSKICKCLQFLLQIIRVQTTKDIPHRPQTLIRPVESHNECIYQV